VLILFGTVAVAAEPSVYERIWDVATLYENEENAAIQSFALKGRLQADALVFDADAYGKLSSATQHWIVVRMQACDWVVALVELRQGVPKRPTTSSLASISISTTTNSNGKTELNTTMSPILTTAATATTVGASPPACA
ncbi:MAG: hypothetical protein MI922_13040, partial [Bacteroidales bacterium]|nr:hypothetical protein [Bacteroidales bacterium]